MGHKQENKFNIVGKVLFVGMPIYYSEKMSKRLLVMEVWADKKYRQEHAFDFVNHNMPLLDNIRENDWVSVDFQLRGTKRVQEDGKARWFNASEALSCTKLES